MKKKLLQINVSLNKGSTGRIAEQIGLLAKSNGFDVYYAHGARYIGKSVHHTIKLGYRWNEYIHAGIFGKLLGFDGGGAICSTESLVNIIDSIQPDIIHLHNIHGYYLNFRILFEYLNKKQIHIIWTLHDCWPFTGGCTFLNHSQCKKWKIKCEKCPLRKFIDNSIQIYSLKKRLFSNYPNLTLIPVSNWLEELVHESFMKDVPTHVIHNGTDLDIFKPIDKCAELINQYSLTSKRIIIGVAAPWSARKGLNDFLQISANMSDEYIIVLIGLNEKQIAKLPPNIIGIKRTENTYQLAKWYSLADVFVNPTYSDNFPTTNIEALACGTPVITYRTGGSPEAIDDKTGIVVEHGDIKMLQEAIETICTSNIDYSVNCRQRAEKYFNKDDRFREYIDLFNQLLRQ